MVLISMAIGQFAPAINVLIGSTVAAYIVFSRKLELLPLLILTNIPITSFFFGATPEYGTFEYSVEVYHTAYVNFLGLPISAGFVATLSIGIMCIINFIQEPERAYPGALKAMFVLWLIGALFAVLISFNGMFLGHNGWSTPLRAFLSLSGVFYGHYLISRSARVTEMLNKDFAILFLIFGVMGCLGIFHHRVFWIGAAIIPALSIFALVKRDLPARCIAIANLVAWTFYCLLGFTLSKETTFTLQALFLFSLILSLVFIKRGSNWTKFTSFSLGVPTLFIIAFYIYFAVIGAQKYGTAELTRAGYELSWSEKIMFKIFDDRARHWGFVLDDIASENKILPIPGNPMKVIHATRGEMYVTYGAHNTYLEAIRQNGVISGGIIITIIIFSILSAARTLRNPRTGTTAVLSIGVSVTLIIGGTTGHYVIGQTAGVYIFLLVGMAIGRYDERINAAGPLMRRRF